MDTLKDLARALRRHHAERLKRTRADYWGRHLGPAYAEPLTPRQLGIVLGSPATCSGLCCGNPRKWFSELTVQEQSWLQHSVAELLDDIDPVPATE